MAQNAMSSFRNLSYAIAVRRSEREIIDQLTEIQRGSEANIVVRSEDTGEEFLLRVSRVQ